MARKNYQVIAKDGAAWQRIHNELTTQTYNTSSIPDRPCKCKNAINHSETRGTYQLSIAEVEELRKNPDIVYVGIDSAYDENPDKIIYEPCSLRFGKNVKNYRTLFKVKNNEYTEVASSLMSITGQLNQGTTDWVLLKNVHPNTPAMNYWQSQGFPLIYDYGIYPSVPANVNDDDPLKAVTQTGANFVDIVNTGWYELEVACDGEYGAVWTNNYPKVPLKTTDDLTQKRVYNPAIPGWETGPDPNFPDNLWGKDRKDIRSGGAIGYRIIQLGELTGGTTLTINFEVRNGSHGDPSKENWNNNPGCVAWKLRYLGNMNLYYPQQPQVIRDTYDYIAPTNKTTAEYNRTGYQILRCAEGTSTNPWSDTTVPISQDISYTNDGTDVDCIVMDDGTWHGHPEWVTDDQDPQHYISGNVLSRHGRSGVLDIFLDAPYYLDPEWFDADPSSRLITRWDGTIVPNETTARDWWLSASNRSPSFTDFGSIVVPDRYTRAENCGTDTTPPTNYQGHMVANARGRHGGGHGTPVASCMYGKNHGWAFNSNKWSIAFRLNQGAYNPPNFTNIDWSTASDSHTIDAVKVFHQYKPVNPKHGTKDPTVTNCSFVGGGISGDYSNYGTWQYQPSPNSWNSANDNPYWQPNIDDSTLPFRWWGNAPDFFRSALMSGQNWAVGGWRSPINNSAFDEFFAMREAANAGVVFVAAAGNNGQYMAKDTDPNFWNARTTVAGGNCSTEGFNCGYFNRGGWPAQHNSRLNITNPSDYSADNFQDVFVIGAMDDQLLGDMRKTPTSDQLVKDTGSRNTFADSCEITASSRPCSIDFLSPYTNNIFMHGGGEGYSNVGTAIDFYAPGDSTLAASARDQSSDAERNYVSGTINYPEHPTTRSHPGGGSYTFRDQFFSGTSAASPVAAGVLACILQQNRDWLPNVLKTNVKLGISNATNWYKGIAPNDPFDPTWHSYYNTKGQDVKIIKEWSGEKTTPNPSYETTSGISPSRPNLNERFSITGSGSHDVKIVAIKEFSTSDAGSPTELRIANGWYPVQIVSTSISSSTLANYKMRVSSNSDQTLEVSSNGGSSYTALTITVVNGNFDTDDSGRFWYYLSVDDSVGLPAVNNPTYNIQTNVSSVNEGATLITTVTTTNVSNGTTLYWSFSGTNINSSDFSSGSLTGSGSISNNSFNFTHVVANDATTEGSETLEIKVFTDAARQIQVATKNVTISDTSGSASYAIVPSTTSVNEGSPLVYGVGTSNVADGTTLYWSLSGSGITAGDFSPSGLTGSGTINNNAFTVTRTLVADSTTEGNEVITFKLFTDSARTNEVASNSSVTIQDTSTTPTTPSYALSVTPTTVNEGDTFTSTVTTTNVAQGTTLYWSAMGASISNNDFSSGSMTGSGTVGFDGSFQFSHTLRNDLTTEGTETIAVKLFTNAGYTQQVGSTVNVTVNDTSLTAPTYNLSVDSTSHNEGGTFTSTVTTSNVADNTTLYWSLSGTNIDANDFSSGSLTGSGTIVSNTFNFSHTIANDTTTEGTETVAVKLWADSARTVQLGSTVNVTINDTSQTPTTPSYVLTPDKTVYNEGETMSTIVTTTNVALGTTLYFGLEATSGTLTTSDVSALFGSGTVAAGGGSTGFSFAINILEDTTTEGVDKFVIKLYDQAHPFTGATLLATSTEITINDTSTTPGSPTYTLSANTNPIDEGEFLSISVVTTNVTANTTLYWEFSGTNIGSADFDNGVLEGDVVIPASGSQSFGTTIKEDTLTEGNETLAVKLYSDSARTTQVGNTLSVTINDTSLSATPTYSLSTTASKFKEGDSFTTTVTTTNVADATTLYWRLEGIDANDLSAGNIEGFGIITNNTFNFLHALANDLADEGDENLQIKLFTDSARTTQVGNTLAVLIKDTSQVGFNVIVTAPNNNEYILVGNDTDGTI